MTGFFGFAGAAGFFGAAGFLGATGFLATAFFLTAGLSSYTVTSVSFFAYEGAY